MVTLHFRQLCSCFFFRFFCCCCCDDGKSFVCSEKSAASQKARKYKIYKSTDAGGGGFCSAVARMLFPWNTCIHDFHGFSRLARPRADERISAPSVRVHRVRVSALDVICAPQLRRVCECSRATYRERGPPSLIYSFIAVTGRILLHLDFASAIILSPKRISTSTFSWCLNYLWTTEYKKNPQKQK